MKNALVPIVFVFIMLAIVSCSLQNPPVTDPSAQLTADTDTIANYLKSKGITALKDPGGFGLYYTIDSLGLGVKPLTTDSAYVKFIGKLLKDGSVFATQNAPVEIYIGGLIAGWQIGLPLLGQGTKATFYIPSGLGYGAVTTHLPANSNLIFNLTMTRVISAQYIKDSVAIVNYIKSLKDTTIYDPQGIQYRIDSLGTGPAPVLTDSVIVTYTGRVIGAATDFPGIAVPTKFLLNDLPAGWRIGMRYFNEGSKVRLYIPSGLIYGNNTLSTPAGNGAVFHINLIKVIHQ